ncbi:unnamed protein product [Didymodactylos carnosus]|uniref:Uncharacterized protein n=1 Tax=Didymodactylos carnosus TaxID=1234261 RepID=A0A8S2WZY0_9BILA|nr:unnamed protein product [Didymodactylos carnosus]
MKELFEDEEDGCGDLLLRFLTSLGFDFFSVLEETSVFAVKRAFSKDTERLWRFGGGNESGFGDVDFKRGLASLGEVLAEVFKGKTSV